MRLGHSAFKFQELYKRFGESAVQLTCMCMLDVLWRVILHGLHMCSNWYDNVMVKFRQQFTPRMASETIPDSKCDILKFFLRVNWHASILHIFN